MLWFVLLMAVNDGMLQSRGPAPLPPYAELRGAAKPSDPAAYAAAAADSQFVLQRLTYWSDGLEVVAYLYAPKEARKLPCVVWNRGSYTRGEDVPEFLAIMHRLAGEGFAVLAPMYRGSAGASGKDELGGADLHDLMNAALLARNLPETDADRLFLYGESRGGMMVLKALAEGFPARAAATSAAFTDLGKLIDADQRANQMAHMIWPDFDQNRDAIVAPRSALRWAEKIRAPLLLMHGTADSTVAPQQTLDLAAELIRFKKSVDVVLFDGEKHSFRDRAAERDALVAAKFKRYLQKP